MCSVTDKASDLFVVVAEVAAMVVLACTEGYDGGDGGCGGM